MTLLEALEAGVMVAATSSLGINELMQAGVVREIDASVTAIQALLTSLLPSGSLESALKSQQVAWSGIRHRYDAGEIKLAFQEVVFATMSRRTLSM